MPFVITPPDDVPYSTPPDDVPYSPSVSAEVERFGHPIVQQGHGVWEQLDYCSDVFNCGDPVATWYCQSKGYYGWVAFEKASMPKGDQSYSPVRGAYCIPDPTYGCATSRAVGRVA